MQLLQLASPFQSPVANYRTLDETGTSSQNQSGSFVSRLDQASHDHAAELFPGSGGRGLSSNWTAGGIDPNGFAGSDHAFQTMDPNPWQETAERSTTHDALAGDMDTSCSAVVNDLCDYLQFNAEQSGLSDITIFHFDDFADAQALDFQANALLPEIDMNKSAGGGEEHHIAMSPNVHLKTEDGSGPYPDHESFPQNPLDLPKLEDTQQNIPAPGGQFLSAYHPMEEKPTESIAPYVGYHNPTQANLDDLAQYTRLDEETKTYIAATSSTGHALILPSDGDARHGPVEPPWEQVSADVLQQYEGRLKYMWVSEGLPRVQHVGFPSGYRVYKRRRADNSLGSLYVWGHPSGRRFTALSRFYVHLRWLIINGGVVGDCACECCKPPTKPERVQQRPEQWNQNGEGEVEESYA